MFKKPFRIFLAILLSSVYTSCASTNFYEKKNSQIFQDDVIIYDDESYIVDGKIKRNTNTIYKSADVENIHIDAFIVSDKLKRTEKTTMLFYDDDVLIAEKEFSNKQQQKKEFNKERKYKDVCYEAYEKISKQNPIQDAADSKGSKQFVINYEKAKVDSQTDFSYFFYCIFGKPFVVLGSSCLSLLKCAGYSFINFIGGYRTMTANDGFFWIMPDTKKDKMKAEEAKAANEIRYPEYHKPFTKNQITVKSYTIETNNRFAEDDKVKIIKNEEYHYNNNISVRKSAEADAKATSSIVGWIGTIITVPVSFVSWLFGAIYGFYASIR